MIEGVINVAEILDQRARREAWRQRLARDSEWVALKAWWQAERWLRRATTPLQRQQARRTLVATARLYRAELRRAWPQWAKVAAARRRGWTYDLPEMA